MFRNECLKTLSPGVGELRGAEDRPVPRNRGKRVRFDGGREFRRVLGVPQNQWWDSTQVARLSREGGGGPGSPRARRPEARATAVLLRARAAYCADREAAAGGGGLGGVPLAAARAELEACEALCGIPTDSRYLQRECSGTNVWGALSPVVENSGSEDDWSNNRGKRVRFDGRTRILKNSWGTPKPVVGFRTGEAACVATYGDHGGNLEAALAAAGLGNLAVVAGDPPEAAVAAVRRALTALVAARGDCAPTATARATLARLLARDPRKSREAADVLASAAAWHDARAAAARDVAAADADASDAYGDALRDRAADAARAAATDARVARRAASGSLVEWEPLRILRTVSFRSSR